MYSLELVVILMVSRIVANNDNMEVLFVVSGADEFGGHPSKIYEDDILRTLGELAFQFSMTADNTQYGLIWTRPKKSPTWEVVTYLAPIQTLLDDMQFFFPVAESGTLSTETGLAGVVGFAIKEVFSKDLNNTQILIVLVHQEVLGYEITKFLHGSACSQVIVSVVVFPWKDKDCSTAESQLEYFNRHLNPYEMLKGELGICGVDQEALSSLSQVILKNALVHKQILEVCSKLLSVTTKKSKIKYYRYGLSTTTNAPVETCIWIFCDVWSIIGAVAIVLALASAIALPIYQVRRERKKLREIRQSQLRQKLLTNKSLLHPTFTDSTPQSRNNSVFNSPEVEEANTIHQAILREQFITNLRREIEAKNAEMNGESQTVDLMDVVPRSRVSTSHSKTDSNNADINGDPMVITTELFTVPPRRSESGKASKIFSENSERCHESLVHTKSNPIDPLSAQSQTRSQSNETKTNNENDEISNESMVNPKAISVISVFSQSGLTRNHSKKSRSDSEKDGKVNKNFDDLLAAQPRTAISKATKILGHSMEIPDSSTRKKLSRSHQTRRVKMSTSKIDNVPNSPNISISLDTCMPTSFPYNNEDSAS